MSAPKILYLVSEDWYFCSHRMPMARAAKQRGIEVVVLTRLNAHGEEIRAEGFRPIPLKLRRGSRNPFAAVATILDITRCYRRERPDLVHHVNLKMCLLGSIAAVLARVPRVVNALTGLGYLFTTQGTGVRLLRSVVLAGLRILNRLTAATIVVQNTDDRDLVVGRRVAAADHVVLIPGSGVDIRRFSPQPPASGVPRVTYVGRMLADKGLRELAEAARLLKQNGRSVHVVMVGPVDAENPQSLTEIEIQTWVREGILEWRGYQADIPRIWAESTIAVLPSYREGMPKSLLEAAASAVPMVATDVPGCRALVVDGETGLLVPVRNAAALAEAIDRLLASPELRDIMGRNARARAEACFADDIIADVTARLYECLLKTKYDNTNG
ncbi:MAG: glycosyltransferase family 4 protein, partial [Rhodospirillales bacterium]|nr:glycosyltransferase family 4 protein [Rhodospirillales bacterium]